jgi:hypothetical protein
MQKFAVIASNKLTVLALNRWLCLRSHVLSFDLYLLSKNNPMMANVIPTSLCHDGASRKNKMPARAMIAAPPAKIAGTADSGPPRWKRRKNAIVPAPTQIPVRTE